LSGELSTKYHFDLVFYSGFQTTKDNDYIEPQVIGFSTIVGGLREDIVGRVIIRFSLQA